MAAMKSRIVLILVFFTCFVANVYSQQGGDAEFSPYVFKSVHLPLKGRNYAGDFFNQDVAYIQDPLLAQAKPQRFADPIKLPTIKPYTVKWSNLNEVSINRENTYNFEKRIDTKKWWP
uniref:Uncharacterized protein n=1 Tax=Panagrellus redivivus TaxID=6233 RepID=A0A7E4W9Z9_PANRE